MKIAMVGLKGIPATWGGVEKIVEAMAIELVKRGHEVTVYCRSYYVPLEMDQYEGVKLVRTPTINTRHLDCPVHTLTATLDTLWRDFDIVHFHSVAPATFCWIPRLAGKKTLVQVHGLGWTDVTYGPVIRWLMKMAEYPAIYLSNVFTTVSEPAVEYFKNTYGRDVKFVTSTTEFHEPRQPDKMKELGLGRDGYVLFVARLTPQKGLHYLIEAFKKVKTDKKLVIAGDVDPGDGLSEYVDNLKALADPRTVFLGWVYSDLLDELFTNAYLFVLPSETEGLSVSLIEAVNFECGLLVSDAPENLDAIQDYGFSFKNMDVDDLARMLQYLLENSEELKSRAKGGRDYVRKRYGIKSVVDGLEKIYADMIKRG